MEIFDCQVLRLTLDFYKSYPSDKFPEILHKDTRPYNCLLFQSRYDYYICIPLRSHIKHKYAFKLSKKTGGSFSGLDYTKIVIIDGKDLNNYLETETVIINKDQFKRMRKGIKYIVNDSQKYIDDYISFIK